MNRPNARAEQVRGRVATKEDINEAFHRLLREAAEDRDERQRAHALQDADAAARESADLLSLARRSATPSDGGAR